MPPDKPLPHQFGGPWTQQKLKVLGDYLLAYTTALQDKPSPSQPFRKAYIDGFAGTGSRTDAATGLGDGNEQLTLGTGDPELEGGLLDGSARIALGIEPGFDKYIFIEKSTERCNQLEGLRKEFPSQAHRIEVRNGEANGEIQHLCAKDWSAHRAVLFLDPYGMQVEWRTIEAVASTGGIDLWLLFPLWMGVNRVLTRRGEIRPSWRRRLDLLLGDNKWYEEFYTVEQQRDLFGNVDDVVHKVSTDVIGRRFVDRLKHLFPGVAEVPGVLRNSRGSPIYLLCFAAANERGSKTALRIAGHLLRDLR